VGRVRRRNDHSLDPIRRDQGLRAGKNRGFPRGGVGPGRVGVENAGKMGAGNFALQKARMFRSHHASSDDADADAHVSGALEVPDLTRSRR